MTKRSEIIVTAIKSAVRCQVNKSEYVQCTEKWNRYPFVQYIARYKCINIICIGFSFVSWFKQTYHTKPLGRLHKIIAINRSTPTSYKILVFLTWIVKFFPFIMYALIPLFVLQQNQSDITQWWLQLTTKYYQLRLSNKYLSFIFSSDLSSFNFLLG